jgi:hypothetical protein
VKSHDIFLKAINEKCVVMVSVDTFEKGKISRKCIPFDYGPSGIFNDDLDRYHLYTLDSPKGSHNLSILPKQLLHIEILEEQFNPEDYITWKPKWHIKRNWEKYS